MRVAICDDDDIELNRLSVLLEKYKLMGNTDIAYHSFCSGFELLSNLKGGEYDLILLDILMPGISGLQVARELKELDKNVKIIFLTASPEFAMESYSVGAYYYLLKPAVIESLFPLLDKIQNELAMQEERGLVLKNREGVTWVSFERLEYVEVMNKVVSFHLLNGMVREVTASLADFEKKLMTRPEFLKVHRSYLVNLNYVESISSKGVLTRSGLTIPVSRLQYNPIKDTYIHFLHQTKTKPSSSDIQILRKAPSEFKRPEGPWRILLVDDDPTERTFWLGVLRSHGCVVETAENGAAALHIAVNDSWDCILLDVMLPSEDGFSICGHLQEITQAPVIFFSCLTDADKQIQGFSSGGVDFITKDIPADLFWAKVETRIKLTTSDRTQLCYGPLLLDLADRKVLIDNDELLLTPIEFDLLRHLAEHTGHIFTPEEIYHIVWGDQPWDGGQLVQVHMSRLRRKLEKVCSQHHFIETVWGQGYRFVPVNNN